MFRFDAVTRRTSLFRRAICRSCTPSKGESGLRPLCTRTLHSVANALEFQDEPLKNSVRRLRQRLKITWNKAQLEDQIQSLRDSNDDLSRLRRQVAELQSTGQASSIASCCVQQMSSEYLDIGRVNKASLALYQALNTAWVACYKSTPAGQLRHTVKLFLDTQVKEDVHMDVGILCQGHQFPHRHVLHFSPLPLNLE